MACSLLVEEIIGEEAAEALMGFFLGASELVDKIGTPPRSLTAKAPEK